MNSMRKLQFNWANIDRIPENVIGIYIFWRGPICLYVGQAKEQDLKKRLNQHYRSIDSAENLNRDDFRFKAMAMFHPETDLISAVESYLIREYCPLWNSVVDGFGNHTPGEGRFDQAKSDWDVIHPGRKFAEKCRGKHNSEESIREKIMSWRMTI